MFLNKIKILFESLLCKKDALKDEVEKMSPADWQNLSNPIYIDNQILCFFSYGNKRVSKAILEMKHKANEIILQNIISTVSEYMKDELGDKITFEAFTKTVIIPVPAHKSKKRQKGYNQSEFIAKALAKELLLPYSDKILLKTRVTKEQRKLKRTERLENLKYSMKASEEIKKYGYQSVIIIDDVCTTGSTFKEAVRALGEIKIKKVFCVALAH